MNGGIRISKLTTLLLAFLVLISISGLGAAAEIFVQPGNSIQTAVNNASSGDIITVKPGNYTENIKVTRGNLTIRSESGNPDNTVLQAKASGNALLLQGKGIKITGFKIVGSSRFSCTGINLSSAANCTIENNKFSNTTRGIYLLRSNWNTVSKNVIVNSGEYGIALQNATNNTISGNTASESQRGVYFGTSDDNTFSSNIIRNNSVFGLFVCGRSDRNLIYNNYFNDTNMTIRNGTGNAYNTTKIKGINIVGGPYIGGNYWGKPDSTGFSETTVDRNGDGISDLVYKGLMGSKYTDSLPLVDPNSPVPSIPVAGFTTNVSSGKTPLDVAFTDTSAGSPISWNWSFGDGAYSTQQDPVHTYSKAGNFTVRLTVSSSTGSNSTTKSNYIIATEPDKTPVVSFWGSQVSGSAPLTVTFTDASTNTPAAWNWSFGDGTYSTEQKPKHIYSKAGTYTVTLTASNEYGSKTKARSNYITVTAAQKPVASFSSNITSGSLPLSIAFTDASTNTPTAWNWSFGDGTANSTVKNPVHTYAKSGNYTVTLTATNSAGSSTVTKTNYVAVTAATTVQKPVVDFWGSRTSGTVPLTIAFTDASTNTPTAWNWSFGDGTYSTEQKPKHTYSKAGTYSITLTASNSAGSATKTRANYITLTGTTISKPAANFSSNVTSGIAPLNVAFTDTSTNTPTAWNWSFGDGTANSTAQNPIHKYSTAGNYTVMLTATNSAGSSTTVKSSYIKVTAATTAPKPVASFWGSRTSGTVPLTITFTDASTNTPTSWNWSFGDGTYSTEQKPKHTYSKAGTYSITLTASNAAGSGILTRANYITLTGSTVSKPVVSFWGSRTSGTAPLTITFTDASTNTPTSWNWSFGDGTYSTLQKPKHTYSKAGTYTVTLTASNAAGSGVLTRSSYIKIT